MAKARSRRQIRQPRVKRSQRTDDYLGVRLPPELRTRVFELAASSGITASEWIRTVIAMAVDSPNLGSSFTAEDQGYIAGRRLGMRVAQVKIQESMADAPTSFEDAIAQYGDEL